MNAEKGIPWIEDLGEAKRLSDSSRKPILLFFHYKHCTGCINTFNKTLKKMSVIDAVNEKFIPVLIETSERAGLAETYNVDWTPTFIVADKTGLEADRWEGYLPEDDFLGHLEMGLARAMLKGKDYKRAERYLDNVLIKYPLSDLAPKAKYYWGVAKYRASGDPSWLTRAYDDIRKTYPDSIWAIKASAWSRDNIESVKKAA